MNLPHEAPRDHLAGLPLGELLALRGRIDRELRHRGIVRSASSVAGELLEQLVVTTYGAQISTTGTKSIDAILPDGRTVQIKARWLAPGTSRRFEFSDLNFDTAVVGLLDRDTYTLIWAREIPIQELRQLAHPYRDRWRVSMTTASRAGIDITERLNETYRQL